MTDFDRLGNAIRGDLNCEVDPDRKRKAYVCSGVKVAFPNSISEYIVNGLDIRVSRTPQGKFKLREVNIPESAQVIKGDFPDMDRLMKRIKDMFVPVLAKV